VTPAEFESEQLCAVTEMTPEAAVRMPNTVYRKRKAPSSVDNENDDDDEEEERCVNNNTDKQTLYWAPAYNNFRLGATLDDLPLVGSDTSPMIGGNSFRFVSAQPSTALLPVAILPSVPLGVLTAVRTPPAACDVIRAYDRIASVAPATVAMGTSVICPIPQWL